LAIKEIKDTGSESAFAAVPDDVQVRIFRVMLVTVIAAVSLAAIIAPWRVTTGLLLGGLLSLLNYSWLRSSVVAIIEANAFGKGSGSRSVRYLLRYLVVTTGVVAAYKLNLVSLVATIFGLCSFVIALFAEAFREFYFSIIHREGIN
jgi:hypothetical protein